MAIPRIIHLLVYFTLLEIAKSQSQATQKRTAYRLAETLEYSHIFNEKSDVSLVVLACGGIRKLQITLKTFFYINTHPINKVFIAHCSTDQISLQKSLPPGYENYQQYFDIIQAKNSQSGLIDALEQVYKRIRTKFVYQTDDQWAMVKGFGFLEQSINILEYAQANSIKISQVTTNYPIWRATARLSPMQWTDEGEAFHQIIPFSVEKYLFLTLSPSVFQFKILFQDILQKNLKARCLILNCPKQKFEFDKCCLWHMGQEIYKKGYRQAYLNDGTSEPNHQYLKN